MSNMKYPGPGRLYDVPARDMTAEEFAELPLTSQRRARESGLYSEVKPPKPAEKPAPKAAEKKDGEK